MGTTASIALELEDGSVLVTTTSWGGHVEETGKILHKNYNNYDKVFDLISRGTMESVLPEINEITFYSDRNDEDWEYSKPASYDSFEEFVNADEESGEEFVYIFRNSELSEGNNKAFEVMSLWDYDDAAVECREFRLLTSVLNELV